MRSAEFIRGSNCIRIRFSAGRFATVIVFVLLLAPKVVSAEPEAVLWGRVIHDIELSSDLPLDRSHYDPYLGIAPGDLLTRTGVKKAIQFLHGTARFSEISVNADPAGEAVILRFNLRHNFYFNRFSLKGQVDLKGRSLWEWVSLPTGDRFTPEKLEESRLAVLNFVRERGYYRAQVKARTSYDENSRQVDTTFDVDAGPPATIRSLEISGVPPQVSQDLRRVFGFRQGKKYDRGELSGRIGKIREYFVDRGNLAAVVSLSESYLPEDNSVSLVLNVSNFGEMRVVVEGFRVDRDQMRRLLPVLTGEGITPETLEKGVNNLREYLEDKGYTEANVQVAETVEPSDVRVLHYIIFPGRRFTVSHIRFKGNRAVTTREMFSAIELQPETFFQNTPYSASRLNSAVEAVKALYEARGYLEARIVPEIEPSKEGTKVGIVFHCEDGPLARLSRLSLSGNDALSTKELMSRIRLTPGNPYSPSLVEQARQALLSSYNDSGYLAAQVAVKVGAPDDTNSYAVEFEIHEGPQSMVDRILVVGNDYTRPAVIQKQIRLKEKEPLSLGKVLQTQQALYSLGVFDQVRVAPQNPDSSSPYQNVVVRLQESKRFTIRYGLGYQEREKVRGTLEFSQLNIFGLARRADIRLRGSSIEQQAVFSLQQPQFRPVPVDSYLTFSALQRKDVSFDSRRLNVSYQYSRPYGNHTWGMLRYSFKNVRISETDVQRSELGREDQPINLSTFSVAMIRDTRDDYLDPSKGFFSSTDFGVTPRLWGEHEYLSFFSQNSYYRQLPKSLTMAASLRFGAAHPFGGTPDLPISERYFAGGSSSLRGFDTDFAGPLDSVSDKPVGGNALFAGSLELRIPFFRFIHLAGFYDSGNVFRRISDIALSGFSHTVGGGLRIKTPFGPLRADYGYNLNLSDDLRRRGLAAGHLFVTVGPPF